MSTIITAQPDRIILAIGPFCWGKGETSTIALKNARQNIPRFAREAEVRVQLWDAPADTNVTDMGGLSWSSDAPPPRELGYATWRFRN